MTPEQIIRLTTMMGIILKTQGEILSKLNNTDKDEEINRLTNEVDNLVSRYLNPLNNSNSN
jgi:archaellum component FlaC